MTPILNIATRIFIATVWLLNGLYCKVLNAVPRHQQIVARILGNTHAATLTKIIGILEILMCILILSRIRSKLCAFAQIAIIALMNIIECILAPDLLLFDRFNMLIAIAFIGLIYWNSRTPLTYKPASL